jgi:SAM-dependent methyltransferase/ribosomal protein S18 acetylase RimI-like enzyme
VSGEPGGARIERLRELPDERLTPLIIESEQAGLRFVRRLAEEWASGRNRFDRPGEALFGALVDGRLVGACGLNVDPYAGDPRVGRVRHLYVLTAHRRLGVGRRLVGAVAAAAHGPFATLRLSTANPAAARLYEALGFRRHAGDAHCTHRLELSGARMTEDPSRIRASYDEIAATYTERIFTELAGKPLDRHLLNRFAEDVRGRGLVADLGCGPGHVARYLHEQGVRMLGVDLSPRMIDWARTRSPEIEFRVGDMRALDLPDGALAGIVAFYSLIHIAEKEMGPTLRELRRVLTPGGLLLVAFHIGEETVHRDELWGHAVSLDFRFLMPSPIVAHLVESGFLVMERVDREPYPEVEHRSRRCYLLARSPAEQ